MSPLNGKTFVLELSREIRFKAKQELINYLREQHAQISYILTASTDYVLVSNDIDTYKTRRAKQLGIPLVDVEYIYECRKREPTDIKRFIVTSAEDKENFSKSGTIPVSSASTSVNKPVKIDVSKIKIWNSDDVELPRFDEITHAEMGKWAIFKETNENSDIYFALEFQIIPEEYYNRTTNDYRLRFRYEKQTITSSKGKISLIQYAFSEDVNELHQLFASYYNRIATMPRITRIRDLLPDKLGSKLLLRSLFLHRIDTQMLDEHVCQLIESLWVESIGDLNKILSVSPESIALKTIIEAEAALLEIKSGGKSGTEAEARFYSLIPHQPLFIVSLTDNRRALTDKTDLCQMLRDLLTVNELTNWNVKASIEAKYRALKCHIETLGHDTQEYATVCDTIASSTNTNEKVIVHRVYSVAKQTDALNFRSTLFNQRQLFHGSKYNNFLGILSRGLVMPKMVVNDLGITRTDIGCLGYGIYFSDSVSTSLKYTTSSTTRPGRRLLCISQVALGDSAKYYSYAPDLTEAPENFHSTHGVKRNNDNNSKFVDDEYAVYNLDQQRLLYIVEVSWMPFDDHNQPLKSLPIIRDSLSNRSNIPIEDMKIPSTIEDEVIQVAEQDYGLICPSSGQLVPLKAFHIRAQLIDITAEVVLYQVYHNTSSVPIEAKYVFPLDENCSVCGFEAHINNKIIKGVVKEKEQAKREYREAIEKGHGAYLMHQEQPEVFSVSVGNLPANCEVVIKITYVAELPIENNDIIFRLPAKVASWQSKQALESKDQTILPSIDLGQETSSMKSVEFSLKASIRMPYEIGKLFSPTHRLRRKITDCIAMIELIDNILLEKDFILSITLKSVNLPRMLNETYDRSEEDSQACMLTFYPRFEMTNQTNEYAEMVFIIDVSNSMDGKQVQQAKQLAHLFLSNMKQNDGTIYFNIVTFGSDNDECFPISSPNTKENLDKAKHFILHSLDHRGNTDLFSVLRQYSLIPSSSKLGRQFILLSDGHINDLKSVLSLLEKPPSMNHDRLFTCSIGDTSNKHTLKRLANQANGGGLNTVFDPDYRSRWKTKVLQILEHIHQPCVTNISIEWHGNADNLLEKFTNQAPKLIRSLFNGMRLTVYRFIQNCHKATLTATINNQEFVTSVFSNKITETNGRILHCLTARAIIQDYENGLLDNDESENELIKKQFKQDLIELSMKYSVVSSFTSFVAIEERDGDDLVPGVPLLDVMRENDVDLLPYIGWDGDRSQIDLIKEKLTNAKRVFDSASISSKLQLTSEYEDLCKDISYRSGGDAKYELMVTVIDAYRTALKEEEKARNLEEKMVLDLINEFQNATADERIILEKRLNEVQQRFWIEERSQRDDRRTSCDEALVYVQGPCIEEVDGDEDGWSRDYGRCIEICGAADSDDDDSLDDGWGEGGGDITMCMAEPFSARSSDVDGKSKMLYADSDDEDICGISHSQVLKDRAEVATESKEEGGDDDDDVGFSLFDASPDVSLKTAGLKLEACIVPAKSDAHAVPSESDEEGGDMGFGLFDDDVPASSIASVKKKACIMPTKSVAHAVSSESDEEEGDMGFGLFDDDVPASSIASDKNKTANEEKKLYESAAHRPSNAPLSVTKEENQSLMGECFSENWSHLDQINIGENLFFLSSKDSLKSRLQMRRELLQPESFLKSASIREKKSITPAPAIPSMNQATQSTSKSRSPSLFKQQKQEEAMPSPSYAPTSPSYSPISPSFSRGAAIERSLSIRDEPTSVNFSQSQLFFDSIITDSDDSNSLLADIRSLGKSSASKASLPPPDGKMAFARPTSTITSEGISAGSVPPPPPPPPPAPSSLFGFSPVPPPLPGSTGFGSSSSTSSTSLFGMAAQQPTFLAQQLPRSLISQPPPAPALFSFNSQSVLPQQQSFAFGTTSTTTNFFMPPAATSSATHLFGQSTGTVAGDSIFAPSAFAGFGVFPSSTTAAYMPSPLPPPPPPMSAGSLNFSSDNISMMQAPQSVYEAQKRSSSSTIQPPPPPPPPPPPFSSSLHKTPTVSFGKASFSPAKQTLAFDASTITSIESAASSPPSLSIAPVYAALAEDRLKASEREKTVGKSRLDDSMGARESGGKTSRDRRKGSRGGRGGFSFASQSPEHEEAFTSIRGTEEFYGSLSNSSMHSMRFTDTRCDEAVRSPVVDEFKLFMSDDNSPVEPFVAHKKKAKSKKSAASDTAHVQDLLLLDVVPLDCGIEDIHGHMYTMIDRNRTIPTRTQAYPVFTNAYAYQTTATIRVFRGQHKLTKYNTFLGEFSLAGLTPNFASQVLEISVRMDMDANGMLRVDAEESRSGAKANIEIDPNNYPLNPADLEQHLTYVDSNPDYRAASVANRGANDPLYMLKGDTENATINFTSSMEISQSFPIFPKFKHLEMTSTKIDQLKRIQFADGSFDLNQDLANFLSIDINHFDAVKQYFSKQGFNSFASNIRNEILRLIATGIILMELFFQIPTSERQTYLIPFDREQIRANFHRHLPKLLLESVDRAIDFYAEKRSRCGIYREQLELNYSSWEQFLQNAIFHIDN